MSRKILRLWQISVTAWSAPVILLKYFHPDTGREYGVGFFRKLWLLYRMNRNHAKITSFSEWLEHSIMATEILRVPRDEQGCVIECGTFLGGSAANLSLVCDLCDRTLEIFDSFEGLPEPSSADSSHVIVLEHEVQTYAKGAFRGSLPDVQKNITRFGRISACNFNVGYFDQTLPAFRKPCVLAFLDVDLVESLRTCLVHLWPLMREGCYLFTHEAHHMEIAGVFFDQAWWKNRLNCGAPGLVGAGTGLGLLPSSGGFRSGLGYAVKDPVTTGFKIAPQTGIV